MNQSWKQITLEIALQLVIGKSDRIFRMKELRVREPLFNSKKPNNTAKTIMNTVSRELQYLRDYGVIEFSPRGNKGEYRMIANPSDAAKLCKKKNSSVGEKMMEQILSRMNIDYVAQFVDPRIRNKNPLPFDFMVKLPEAKILIEYDGADHNQVIGRSRSHVKNCVRFFERKYRDALKTRLAKKYGYILIRVNCEEFEKSRPTIEQMKALPQLKILQPLT